MKRLVVKFYDKMKYAEEDGHRMVFLMTDPATLTTKAALLYFEDTETGQLEPVEVQVRY